jgi:uncharacterized cupredoxin-like copper-binding protein
VREQLVDLIVPAREWWPQLRRRQAADTVEGRRRAGEARGHAGGPLAFRQRSLTARAGSASTVTVTLQPGTYTYYCPVPAHRAAGMTGTLTVG